ncbi:ABC transporter ATP-binding protein [Sciscionella marina]|uniref:ABC transporter ATP-binding protein n=1 Tax=Sciscionella marina TaxID=508770 RepID=UPI000365DC8F|nr:ABC transporter ATP-binding protein [Sciscionella marina]
MSTSCQSTAGSLTLTGIGKNYGAVTAVRDIDLSVGQGEFVSLLGPSGSGKTTTLNIIAGFEAPDVGSVALAERDITRLPTHKRNLGMVLQGYALFPHMTVAENVGFPLKVRRKARPAAKKRIEEALEIVGLGQLRDRYPRQLSGGQQQRVAVARSIVHKPPVLLMDEPLSALDRSLRKQMQAELRRVHQEVGTTIIYVTHDQDEALGLSDRTVVMRDARVRQIGSPREIYERPADDFVAGFVGAATFLDVHCLDVSPGHVTTRAGCGQPIRGSATDRVSPGDRLRVVLRPEDAHLIPDPARQWNTFAITVTEKVFLGDRVLCTGTLPSGERCSFWISHDEDREIQIGRPTEIAWPAERSVLVRIADDQTGH